MNKDESSSEKKNILLIDDDFDVWENLLYKIFPDSKYELKLFKKMENVSSLFKYDLLIVDYFLEDEKTGKAWVEKNIRNRDPYIPVIFWTSSYNPEIIKETVVGDKVFFKKVLDLNLFKKEVDKSINKYRKYHNYPLYNSFFNTKIISGRKRELAHKVYVNTSKYLESFFAHSKYHSVFNGHGLIHAQNVLNNLSKLMYPIANEFTEDQFLVAYIATILHDFGMIPVHYNLDMEYKNFKTLRSNHAKTIFWWLISGQIEKILEFDFEDYIDNNRVKKIKYNSALITLYHDCHHDFKEFSHQQQKAFDKVLESLKKGGIGNISNICYKPEKFIKRIKNYLESSENIGYRTIAGLVALADKLDYGESRIPVSMIKESPYRSLYDEYEYLMNWCFKDFKFEHCFGNDSKKKDSDKDDFFKIIIRRKVPEDGQEFTEGNYDLFEDHILNNSEGKINSKTVFICSLGLKNTLKKKIEKIQKCFNSSTIKFLKNLEIVFKESIIGKGDLQNSKREYDNIFRNIPKETSIFNNITDTDKDCESLNILEVKLLQSIFGGQYHIEPRNIEIVSTGFSGEKVLHIKSLSRKIGYSDKKYENNACIIKIGDADKIHQEVINYKKYAVPYIEPHSLIGYIDEYKYLDKAAYISYITPSEAAELDNKINYDDVDSVLQTIKRSLSIFYKKIKPFSDRELYTKIIDNFDYEKGKIEDLIKHEKTKDCEKKIYSSICEVVEKIMKFIKNKKPELTSSISHADFTFRNIMQLNNDYVFIDFASTDINHFFQDFAKLEHFIIERLIKNSSEDEDKEKVLDCYKNTKSECKNTKKVKKAIEKILILKLSKAEIDTEDESNFEFEMNLARLLVNLNSVRFETKIPLSLLERKELVEYFWRKVKNGGGQ